MNPWVWWAPLVIILLAGALFAFRLGWIAAHLTETEAIEAYAARYVERTGGVAGAADCTAIPGTQVWLVMRCGRGADVWEYQINRFGGLVREGPPAPMRETGRPET